MNWKGRFITNKIGLKVRLRRDSDKSSWNIDIDYDRIYKITEWHHDSDYGIILEGGWTVGLEFFEEHFEYV